MNGQVERYNRTLLGMLRCLPAGDKLDWKSHVNKVVHAYNCTRNDSTGYAPFELLFGRKPRLPIDFIFSEVSSDEPLKSKSYDRFRSKWEDAMREAYRLAAQHAKTAGMKGKIRRDSHLLSSVLAPGDRDLVRNLREKGGPGKMISFWEDQVHVVESRIQNSPVYEIRGEDGKGPIRRLHRNLLLQCNDLLAADAGVAKVFKRERKGRLKHQPRVIPVASSSDSDSSSSGGYVLNPAAKEFIPSHSAGTCTQQSCDNMQNSQQTSESFHSATSSGVGAETVDDTQQSAESIDTDYTRAERVRRPPNRLTYDQMGKPTAYAWQLCCAEGEPVFV